MNIVEHFKNKVAQWNKEQRCGFCYEFGAPLNEDTINKQQTEKCCVNVLLTNLTWRNVRSDGYGFGGRKIITSCIYSFDLSFLIKSSLGINNYNEVLGHPIEESKWETIFNPLLNCFSCEETYNCEDINNFIDYKINSGNLVFNYTDNVYDGIKIRAEIEIKH